jgi:hypothetical protein
VSAKLSLRRFATLDSDEQQPADTRPAALDRLIQVPGDVMDALTAVFGETGLLEDQARVAKVLEARREVQASWGRAAKSFIEAGKALLRLDAALATPAEKAALKAGCERLFPFSDPVASQLRAVARSVESGLLTPETCPASYSVAYQLCVMEAGEFAEARRRGLVSPSVTRAAIIAFRKERRKAAETGTRIDEAGLRAEAQRLANRIAQLHEEIRSLESRRAEIARLLAVEPEERSGA